MTKLLTPDAEKAMSLPLGIASPLWLMFAGAAAAGAALFWARAWMKPVNIEALIPLPKAAIDTDEPMVEAVERAVMAAVEATDAMVEVAADAIDAVVEASVEADKLLVETAEAMVEPMMDVAEHPAETEAAIAEVATEAPSPVADDLTRLTGIGPKLAASLAERGVTRFADIAAWTADDIAKLDSDMKLMGRIDREAWVAQAKRFAEVH